MQRQCCPSSVYKFVPGVVDIAALRSITNHANYYYTFVSSPDDSDWWYDETSLLPDDGVNVVQPNDVAPGQPGRWIKYSSGAIGVNKFVNLLDTPGAIDPNRGLFGNPAGNALVFVDLPEIVRVNFAFNTASPLVITSMLANQAVIDTEITIITAFDDASAILLLGTPADLSKIMPANFTKPSKEATYGNDANIEFAINETVILTIIPNASTVGTGQVLLKTRRS